VSRRGSGVDAVASNNKVDGGESKGRFSRVVKWSCQRAITDALSDSSVPSADINGADTVVRMDKVQECSRLSCLRSPWTTYVCQETLDMSGNSLHY